MDRQFNGKGVVRAISYPGVAPNPAVRVTLDCADGSVLLVFQSRMNLHAIGIGQTLKVAGNCVMRGKIRIIYNPQYEIIALQ